MDYGGGMFGGNRDRAGRYLKGDDVLAAIREARDFVEGKPHMDAAEVLQAVHDSLAECMTHDSRG